MIVHILIFSVASKSFIGNDHNLAVSFTSTPEWIQGQTVNRMMSGERFPAVRCWSGFAGMDKENGKYSRILPIFAHPYLPRT
jgi:hypothetical protein